MQLPNTPDNAAYAASVNARINADTANVRRTNMLMAAKTAVLYAAACGIVVVMLGAATGLAFFGFSFISDSRASLDQLTAAFSRALQATTLHTTGTVALKSDAKVALADGGRVGLDPSSVSLMPGGIVSLAPGSTVSIKSGMSEIVRQMKQTTGSAKQVPEFDEVTAFQNRSFKDGEVGTGWKYHVSDNFAAPYYQYCFYSQTDDETHTTRSFELAADGQIYDNLRNPFNIDMRQAFKLCVWHP